MENRKRYLPYLLPFRCVIFFLFFVIGAFVSEKKMDEISNWWSIIASMVNVVTILILLFIAKKQESSYWELINYQKGKTSGKQIVSMSIVILFVGMVGMYLAGYVCYGVIPYAAPMMIAPIPLWLAIINIFVLPIMVGHIVIDVATVMQIFATSFIPGLYEKMCTW